MVDQSTLTTIRQDGWETYSVLDGCDVLKKAPFTEPLKRSPFWNLSPLFFRIVAAPKTAHAAITPSTGLRGNPGWLQATAGSALNAQFERDATCGRPVEGSASGERRCVLKLRRVALCPGAMHPWATGGGPHFSGGSVARHLVMTLPSMARRAKIAA